MKCFLSITALCILAPIGQVTVRIRRITFVLEIIICIMLFSCDRQANFVDRLPKIDLNSIKDRYEWYCPVFQDPYEIVRQGGIVEEAALLPHSHIVGRECLAEWHFNSFEKATDDNDDFARCVICRQIITSEELQGWQIYGALEERHVDAVYKIAHDLSDEDLLERLETLGAGWEGRYGCMTNGYRVFGMPLTSAELAFYLRDMRYPVEHAGLFKLKYPLDMDSVQTIFTTLQKEPASRPKTEGLRTALGHSQMSDRELIASYGQPRRLNGAELAKHLQ